MNRMRQLTHPGYFLRRALQPLLIVPFLLTSIAWAQPNVVVVMVDDLGLRPFNQLLQDGWLPNIENHLINSGIEFNNAFVTNSACCPSRVTFLRGQYSHNHRVFSNHSPDPFKAGIAWPGWFSKNGVPGRNESTLATWLQDAGYHTVHVGKYLNGYGSVAPDDVADPRTYVPPGWSEWYASVGISTYQMFDVLMNHNGMLVQYGNTEADYQTDIYKDLAVDFIQRAANMPEPFFLFVSPLAPHLEVIDPLPVLQANDPRDGLAATVRPAPRHEHLIDGDSVNGEMTALPQLPSFNEADLTDKPSCPRPLPPEGIAYVTDPMCVGDALPWRPDPDLPNLELQIKTMLTSMLAVDDMVGDIVTELSNTGVLDNTVIIFVSDNGWMSGEHRLIGKDYAYEESIRIPLIIRSPSGLTSIKSDLIVLNNDLAPTIIDIAGVAAPYEMDGTSMVPLLSNPANVNWHRHAFLYEHWFVPSLFKHEVPTQFAFRRKFGAQDFSYMATHSDQSTPGQATHHEFYNLPNDPYQMESLPLPGALTSLLDQVLRLFLLCSGTSCQDLENL